MFVDNTSRPLASPAAVQYCDTFMCRLRGLMFRSSLAADDGLLLVQSRDSRLEAAIHMLFVPFDLAVFWIDSNYRVVDRTLARGWRPAYIPAAPARYILELHPARQDDYRVGDQVHFRHD